MNVVDEIADHLVGLAPSDLRRVGVDGRSAAGKSTLADALAEALRDRGSRVERGSIDDFHPAGHVQRSANEGYTAESYYAEAFDYLAFRRWVLAPREHDVEVLLVDGVFLLHPTIEDCWDLTIWVQIDLTTMVERALQRDVAWVGSPDVVRARYEQRFVPAHLLYEAQTRAPERAEFVVRNDDLSRPTLVRR